MQTGTAEPSKYTHYLYDSSGQRVKKITRKQGGSYTATTYIDGAFEYTKKSAGFDSIPNLTIGTWVIGTYSSGSGEQNLLHIMGGATRRIGDALGDTTPAIKYNIADHLGSSAVQLDTNGTTVSLEEYYPFGETSFGSYAKKRYRFCGKEKDEESGLYYYGMRYYSAWTCRFISVDPLAAKYAHLTPYAYADNKPINYTDIDGAETGSTEPSEQSGGQNAQPNPDTDRQGEDVVNNIKTRVEKGEIQALVGGSWGRAEGNVANEKDRQAILDHWNNVPQESQNLSVESEPLDGATIIDDSSSSNYEQEGTNNDETPVGDPNNAPNNDGGEGTNEPQKPVVPPENQSKADTLEDIHDNGTDSAGKILGIFEDYLKYEKNKIEKKISAKELILKQKEKVANLFKENLKKLHNQLELLNKQISKFKWAGAISDAINIIISGIKAWIAPTAENIINLIEDTFSLIIEKFVGRFLIWGDSLVSAGLDLIKSLPIYKNLKQNIIDWYAPFAPEQSPQNEKYILFILSKY